MNLFLIVAGLYLLLSAFAKANDFAYSQNVIASYRLASRRWTGRILFVVIVIEAGLGAAMSVGSREAALMAIALLATMSAVAVLARYRSGAEDCGCHGLLLRLTPAKSTALTVLVLVLVCTGLYGAGPTNPWAVLAAGLLAAAASACWSYYSIRRGPVIDLTLFKAGRTVSSTALNLPAGSPDVTRGKWIVLILTAGCTRCEAWGRVMASARTLPDMPRILALYGGGPSSGVSEKPTWTGRLEAVELPLARLLALSRNVPAGIVLDNGHVEDIWANAIPDEIVRRLRARRSAAPHQTSLR